MSREERSLYARIAAGDDRAFRALIQPYERELAKFVRHQLAGDTRAVDDVLQETYLAAYRAVSAGVRPKHIRPWLYTIARNQASNARSSCKPVTPLDESAAATDAFCPTRAAEQGEWMDWLMSAISELPARQRTALVEHVFEGRSYDEIARRQQTTIGAVKTLMHRARQGLTESAAWRSVVVPAAAWIARVLPRRTHAVVAGKLGAKSALVGQALAAALFATGALIVVQGLQVPPVKASVVQLTGRGHPRRAAPRRQHKSGRHHARLTTPERVRREGRHAIRRCTRGERLPRRIGVPALHYAIEHLPAEAREYTNCAHVIFAAELRATERGHRHPGRREPAWRGARGHRARRSG